MRPEDIKELILFEDNHLLAVNKPSGTLVQPDPDGNESLENLVKEFIKKRDDKPGNVFLGVIHRLDRPVSGIVLFAKSSKALTRMNQIFKDRKIEKTYFALVKNRPPEVKGNLEGYIRKDPKQNKSKWYSKPVEGAKSCKTEYLLLGSSDSWNLLKVLPHTGRHHQIRVHLASINCPIGGDLKYGSARSNKDGSLSLHAKSLKFEHPISKETLTLQCPNPKSGVWVYFKQFD